MKLLVYRWGSVSEPLFCEALKKLGIEYVEYGRRLKNYHSDAGFAQEMIELLHAQKAGMVFSYDYFPMIAMICEVNKIPYVSWIYDCPQYTLLSKTLVSPYNYIFCFDRVFAERLREMGAMHVEHCPLAGDLEMLARATKSVANESIVTNCEPANGAAGNKVIISLQETKDLGEGILDRLYGCEVSFIGNLYNGANNRFRKVMPQMSMEEQEIVSTYADEEAQKQEVSSVATGEVVSDEWEPLSPYVAGCAEGLVQAQLRVYGYNFLKEALLEQPEVTMELVEKCKLTLGAEYIQDDLQMAADVLGMEISAREREEVLKTISKHYPVRLYTSSKLPESLKNQHLQVMGYADYEKDLPLIYHYSKINLNITSKTIESGIPQRIFDVLNCGGFCLTNYQPEVAEYFEDGEELVMYTDMEDLLAKVSYYLEHEEERKQIAENGQRKVERCFKLMERVQGMLESAVRQQEVYETPEAMMQIDELKQNVTICMERCDYQRIQEYLRKGRKWVKRDNDLATLYYMAGIWEKESQKGKVTVYKRTIQETVEPFYELQRRVRRLEWWDDYEKQEIFNYMMEQELSVYELQRAVETACVDKKKVWRRLSE